VYRFASFVTQLLACQAKTDQWVVVIKMTPFITDPHRPGTILNIERWTLRKVFVVGEVAVYSSSDLRRESEEGNVSDARLNVSA
jgi:hypothetical protein